MKKTLIPAFALLLAATCMSAEDLVILHTNDTHSAIYPDDKGRGGVLQRKAVIDSVRAAEPNVLLVDAGDFVQGTVYFKFFHGDVEYPLMNLMGYDVQILGNHEFDNGLDDLAKRFKTLDANLLSANYDFTGTPAEGVFQPFTVKEIGGKKVGILGINIDPESMISKKNYPGMQFLPVVETANATARHLKKDLKCDLVVAVTHIGYDDSGATGKVVDTTLIPQTRDIDVVIGGHTHTVIDPSNPDGVPYLVKNAAGRDVLVAQTGSNGRNLGYIKIDLDKLKGKNVSAYTSKLIPVTDRFADESLDPTIKEFLAPFKHAADSVNSQVIGRSLYHLKGSSSTGGYPNFASDFIRWYATEVADTALNGRRVDLGLVNVGGIRHDMPQGDITKGEILSTFPFGNKVVIIEVTGADLLEAMRAAALKGGEAISGNARVAMDSKGNLKHMLLDMKELDPDKTYVVATLDYLAEGNDGLKTLANGRKLWQDDVALEVPILNYIETLTAAGLPVAPDLNDRFVVIE